MSARPSEGAESNLRREQIGASVVIVLYCVAYALQVRTLPLESTAYPYFLIGAVLLLVCVDAASSLQRSKVPSEAMSGKPDRLTLRAVAVAVTAFVFPFLADAGFLIALFVAATLIFRLLARFGWVGSVLLAALVSPAVTIILTLGLSLSVPSVPFLELPWGL